MHTSDDVMRALTSSVALCTYNGARYVREQIESILQQTHLPDEILLFDDDSRDGTAEIAHAILSKQTEVKNWRVHKNAKNLGYVKNFEQACAACSKDIIFLCDQDDIWCPDKITRFLDAFSDPQAYMVFSDGWVCDQAGKPFGGLFDSFQISPNEREQINSGKAFPLFCTQAYATGAASAIRRQLLDMALPFPDTGWHHDEWLALIAAACEHIHALEEKTFLYRLHDQNQVGIPQLSGHRVKPLQKRLKDSLNGNFAAAMAIRARTLASALQLIAQGKSSNDKAETICDALSEAAKFMAYRGRARSLQWFLEIPRHLQGYRAYTPSAVLALMLDMLSAASGTFSRAPFSHREAR